MPYAVHVYPALIKRAATNLENSKRKKKMMIINGITYLETIDLEILENERILMLLTRSRREKQGDLFHLNVQENHK